MWLDGGACPLSADSGVVVSPHTIDRIELRDRVFGGYDEIVGLRASSFVNGVYLLSDGTTWESGAGWGWSGAARVVRVERMGASIRYHMVPPSRLLERTDYNAMEHSAQYGLDPTAHLVLVAEAGGTVGTIRTEARIGLDEVANYRDERFHHLSAPICSIVPFVATFTLQSPWTFTETLFEAPFRFRATITVDLRSPRL